jgi:hypothetical protein
MKKIKDFKKWSLVQKILPLLFGGIVVLWLFGLFMQFISSAKTNDYSMFKEYGMVALTVFGFTLIGGIFEKSRNKPEIVMQLFDSSLSFLTTSIAFYFMYSFSSALSEDVVIEGESALIIIVGASSIALFVSFYGIIFGLLNLYQILINYRVSLDNNK